MIDLCLGVCLVDVPIVAENASLSEALFTVRSTMNDLKKGILPYVYFILMRGFTYFFPEFISRPGDFWLNFCLITH